MKSTVLGLLHTSSAHIPTFDRLAAEVAPDVVLVHLADETLLADARRDGLTPELRARVRAAVQQLEASGAHSVLCTCSTLGGLAEAVGNSAATAVLRVDRPMAARAVQLGPRIVVVAALASTLTPTLALVTEEANRVGRPVKLLPTLCPTAWEAFEAGNLPEYYALIAGHARTFATQADVFVLAQASMAPAAAALADLPIPVLSSPRLGLLAALGRNADGSAAESADCCA